MIPLRDCKLVLASSSRYRRELLERFGAMFTCTSPDIDETPLEGELVEALAARLAREKARVVAMNTPGALVIGSDQVADLDGKILGKPGNAEVAQSQLLACSNRAVAFHTAVCVIDTRGTVASEYAGIDITRVMFRALDSAEIERYLAREKPFDCAGSFRCEGLGIALFEAIETSDPTALVGLPLILLARLLRDTGVAIV